MEPRPVETIIDGSFRQQDAADRAMSYLHDKGFPTERTAKFFVNPPGQHDLYIIGGDVDESPGTEGAPAGSAVGAVVGAAAGVAVGLAAAPVLGPGAAVAGTGAGSYVGSLYGALGNMDNKRDNADPNPPQKQNSLRKAGVLVAVSVKDAEQENVAIDTLRECGAVYVERTEGIVAGGDWTDFDPLKPVTPITNA
jgi:hypothetical protein